MKEVRRIGDWAWGGGTGEDPHCWEIARRDLVQLSFNTCPLFKSKGWHSYRETREIWIKGNYEKMDSLLLLVFGLAE